MSWQTIRPQIQTFLQGIAGIQEVKGTPSLKFTGYPSAYVVQSDNVSEFETTSENQRIYAFIVRLFYQTKNIGVDTAVERLEKVVDTVLDELDKEDQRDSSARTIGISLPSGYQFLSILAHPSEWGELPEQELVMAEIRIQIKLSRDIEP